MMEQVKRSVLLVFTLFFITILTGIIEIKAAFTLDYEYTVGESVFSDQFDQSLSKWMLQLGGVSWNSATDGSNNIARFSYPGPAEGIMTGLDDYNQLVNYSYSMNLRFDEGEITTNGAAGLVFRYKDADNMYMLRIKKSNDSIELYKKNQGTWVSLVSKKITDGVVNGAWYKLQIDVVNNHMIGYLNDQKVIEVSEPENNYIYSGNFGFRMYQGNFSIDNIEVRMINTDVTVSIPGDKDPNLGRTEVGQFENSDYKIRYFNNFSFQVINKITNSIGEFLPNYTIIRGTNPAKGTKQETISPNNYFTFVSWDNNANLFSAPGSYDRLYPNSQVYDPVTKSLTWTYPSQTGYTFTAKLILVDGHDPELDYSLNSSTSDVFYSIGYTGVFDYSIDSVDWVYMPPYWSGKRKQPFPYLVDEARVGLPVAMYSVKGSTIAIAPKPESIYTNYQLLSVSNSRYGFAIQNAENRMTPQYFAPIYGGEGSRISGSYNSKLSLVVNNSTQYDMIKDLAYRQFGFDDYRQNRGFTLNDTLDNLVNFILNSTGENWVYWDPNTKTYEYVNDKPGYGRQQSMIYALGLAYVRDDFQMYEERAIPTIEYMVSRNTQYMKIKENSFDSDYPMGGPVTKTFVDFAALYEMTGKTNQVYKDLAIESFTTYIKSRGIASINDTIIDVNKNYSQSDTEANFRNFVPGLLAMYKVTNEERFLTQALKVSNDYIDKRVLTTPKSFSGNTSSWWYEYASLYDILEEMYYVTNDPKYMDAAVLGMREFITVMNLTPTIPTGDVTVDGQTVPAWVVSDIGLTPEMGGTSDSHRGIMMPYMTGHLERFAEWSNDDMLSDIARSNIIGRYANYPGYAVRNGYHVKYYEANYPLQPYSGFINSAHMNHPVPMASMIIDYLVSDVYNRSNKEIYFPTTYTNTGAYFNSQVVGPKKGSFYGNSDVSIWIPEGLVTTSNKQFNHIAAYDNENVYLSFSNQSFSDEESTITLNKTKLNLLNSHQVTIWYEDGSSEIKTMNNGILTIRANAKGLTSIKIHGATPILEFQDDFNALRDHSTHRYASIKTRDENLGLVGGYLLSESKSLNTFYMYSGLTPNETSSVTFKYSFDGGETWKEGRDTHYPYEFAVPITGSEDKIDFYLINSDNQTSKQYWVWVSDQEEPPVRNDDPVIPPNPNENSDQDELTKLMFETNFSLESEPFIFQGNSFEIKIENSNYFLVSKDSKNESLALFGGNWQDQILTTKLNFSTMNYGSSGIIVKAQNEKNYYLIQVVQAVNKLKVIKVVDGVNYNLTEDYVVPYVSLNKDHTLTVTTVGNEITVLFNNVIVASVVDNNQPFVSGRAGLRTNNSNVHYTFVEAKLILNPEEEKLYETDFTNGLPSDWEYSDSNWKDEIFDNKAALVYRGVKGIATFGSEQLTNYSVRALMNFQNYDKDIKSGIIIRYQNENNYYYVRGFNGAGGEFQFIKVVNGVPNVLETVIVRGLAKNQWYDLEVAVLGERFDFYLNGELKMTLKDNEFASGTSGIIADDEDVVVRFVEITALTSINFVEKLEFSEENYTVNMGKSMTLTPNITPIDFSNKNVYWIISDPSVVTIDDNGVVTPLKEGEVTVYAFSHSGYNYDSVQIKVLSMTENPNQDNDNQEQPIVKENNNPPYLLIVGIAGVTLISALSVVIIKKRKSI